MRSDPSRELRLLRELGMELAAVGVYTRVRDDLRALAVGTGRPGINVWVFISPFGQRFACHLDSLREYLTSDPRHAAREIAIYVRSR